MAVRDRDRMVYRAGKRGPVYRDQLDHIHQILNNLPGEGQVRITDGRVECDHVAEIPHLSEVVDLDFQVFKAVEERLRPRGFGVSLSRDFARFSIRYDDEGDDDYRSAADLLEENLLDTRPAWKRRFADHRRRYWAAYVGLWAAYYLLSWLIGNAYVLLPLYFPGLLYLLVYDSVLERRCRRISVSHRPQKDRWWKPSRLWREHRVAVVLAIVTTALSLLGSWWFSR